MMTRAAVGSYLLDYEKERLAVHRHPVVIAGPAAVAIIALMVGIYAPKLLIASGIALVWAGWRVLNWQSTWFVLTTKRLIFAHGVFAHDIDQMPLAKVTDMKMHQSNPGQWLGWWDFIVETAGQNQAMETIRYLPYPMELYQEINNQVYSDNRNEELRGFTDQAPSEDDGE